MATIPLNDDPMDRCRHCGKTIRQFADGAWVHLDLNYSRGCRAASWEPGKGWDETIDRAWQATPKQREIKLKAAGKPAPADSTGKGAGRVRETVIALEPRMMAQLMGDMADRLLQNEGALVRDATSPADPQLMALADDLDEISLKLDLLASDIRILLGRIRMRRITEQLDLPREEHQRPPLTTRLAERRRARDLARVEQSIADLKADRDEHGFYDEMVADLEAKRQSLIEGAGNDD